MTSYVHFVHRNSHRNSTIQHIGTPRLTSQVQKIPWQTSQVDFSQILCLSVKKQEFFQNSEVEFLCRFCTQEVIDVRTQCSTTCCMYYFTTQNLGSADNGIHCRIAILNITYTTLCGKTTLLTTQTTMSSSLIVPLPICSTCQKACFTHDELKCHERGHTKEKPYVCQDCEKGFTQSGALATHLKTVHSDEKPYNCGICNMSFAAKYRLQSHEITHSGERPFQCKECNKDFPRSQTLKEHLLIHSGEKLFSVCDQRFSMRKLMM